MPKSNYAHIAIVMDRSGSMSNIAKDMEGGLKNFINDQKNVEGTATLTLAKFDDTYELVYDFVTLDQATSFRLEPRGSTALLDAMGRTMEEVRTRINGMDDTDKPSKVIFIFVTDGGENASRSFNRQRIFDMISDLRNAENDVNRPDENGTLWEFIFLGANQDAISEGGNLGIRSAASMTYDASAAGSAAMFTSLNRTMSDYRTKSASYEFTQQDRDAQGVQDSSTKTATTKRSRSYNSILDIHNAAAGKTSVADVNNTSGITVSTETTIK